MAKKKKATFKTMVNIFDKVWLMADNTLILPIWRKELKKNGWTDEEFDGKLTEELTTITNVNKTKKVA